MKQRDLDPVCISLSSASGAEHASNLLKQARRMLNTEIIRNPNPICVIPTNPAWRLQLEVVLWPARGSIPHGQMLQLLAAENRLMWVCDYEHLRPDTLKFPVALN